MKRPENYIKAYKVIGEERYGTNVTGALWKAKYYSTVYEKNHIRHIIEQYPFLFPKYRVNSKVRALEGSLGIFCFQTYQSAKRFIKDYIQLNDAFIIEVYGKPPYKNISQIKAGGMNLYEFISNQAPNGFAPEHCIGFDEIIVGKRVKNDLDINI